MRRRRTSCKLSGRRGGVARPPGSRLVAGGGRSRRHRADADRPDRGAHTAPTRAGARLAGGGRVGDPALRALARRGRARAAGDRRRAAEGRRGAGSASSPSSATTTRRQALDEASLSPRRSRAPACSPGARDQPLPRASGSATARREALEVNRRPCPRSCSAGPDPDRQLALRDRSRASQRAGGCRAALSPRAGARVGRGKPGAERAPIDRAAELEATIAIA